MFRKENFDNVPQLSIKRAFVPFEDSKSTGKCRPVVVLHHGKYMSTILRITSSTAHKNSWIALCFYKITDWKNKNLSKPSYVNLMFRQEIPNDCFVQSTLSKSYAPLSHRQSYQVARKYKVCNNLRLAYDKKHKKAHHTNHSTKLEYLEDSNDKVLKEFN